MCHRCDAKAGSAPKKEPIKVDRNRRNLFKWMGAALVSLSLPGCATTPHSMPTFNQLPASRWTRHVMAQGETVWRVGKIYGVSAEQIIQLNNIYDVRDISIGTELIIPAEEPMIPAYFLDEVPLFYNNGKWKYIIIHHTATDIGDAQSIDRAHRARGYHSLGYHFLIGNGTKGKRVGQIEPGPRWLAQQDGAHCRADDMNAKGIGLCVVGNYSETYVSDEQLNSLAYVTRKLMNQYGIPASNILRHGEVMGAATECPGNLFPWTRFRSLI